MAEHGFAYTAEVRRGDWVRERLGDRTTIAVVVPQGFEAYARVLHPVEAQLLRWDGDTPVTEERLHLRWRDVAERCGTVWHPLMQWSGVVAGHTDPGRGEAGWRYHEPRLGQLPLTELAAISRILARHTRTPDDCTAGLWEGYGWIHGGHAVSAFVAIPEGASRRERSRLLDDARGTIPPGLPPEVRQGPRLKLPGRAYLLFSGSIRVFKNHDWTGDWGEAGAFWEQTPNQLWPADHAWFLASEIDFDSTVIGGSRALVEELVASPDLECVEIPAGASLAHDADKINPGGRR